MPTSLQATPVPNKTLWAGRIMSGLVVLFLIFDGTIKLIPLDIVTETSRQLGIPEHLAPTLGVLTLIGAALYAYPRTSALGAIMLTGYLGGAVYVHVRAGSAVQPHPVRGLSRPAHLGRTVSARRHGPRAHPTAPMNVVNRSIPMSAPAASPSPAQRDLVITRVYDAPRELVWKAWTDPKHMTQWWGPKAFTNPVCELDVRPGGRIWIVMRGPKGSDYDNDFPMSGTFREVVPNTRLVFMAVAEDQAGKPLLESLTTVTFEAQGNKTKLTVQARAVGLAPIAPQMLAGMEAGWTQSLEKLADLLADTR